MRVHNLTPTSGHSAGVTLPLDHLREDGLVDEQDDIVDSRRAVKITRLGSGSWLVVSEGVDRDPAAEALSLLEVALEQASDDDAVVQAAASAVAGASDD
ncbi:hypothetical protein BRD17_08380 [Halobacteriales archaeon SW_7_68_16]|nr:MAG: hypothetical protein BRD17_08380 [Halobacteriales archaeon SW_7_68_16]